MLCELCSHLPDPDMSVMATPAQFKQRPWLWRKVHETWSCHSNIDQGWQTIRLPDARIWSKVLYQWEMTLTGIIVLEGLNNISLWTFVKQVSSSWLVCGFKSDIYCINFIFRKLLNLIVLFVNPNNWQDIALQLSSSF